MAPCALRFPSFISYAFDYHSLDLPLQHISNKIVQFQPTNASASSHRYLILSSLKSTASQPDSPFFASAI
jgi:hypothetical protein